MSSRDKLLRRISYGGRKGRAAERRLRALNAQQQRELQATAEKHGGTVRWLTPAALGLDASLTRPGAPDK